MATLILPLHGASFSRDDGIALATQILNELVDTDTQEACHLLDPATNKLRPDAQRNILAEYLAAIDATGSPEVRAGFTAALSDYLACAVGGMTLDPDLYERALGTEASHG